MNNILWLLVGRGGSRGVPGKNLRRIGGKSLVQWKLEGALAAGAKHIVVSSDSEDIRREAVAHGAEIEIARPWELASDDATTASVVKHALEYLAERALTYDAVMLLEPSTPYTKPEHYTKALAMYERENADLVVGMKESAPHTAFIGDVRPDCSVTPIVLQFQRMARRRQDFALQWTMAGNLYLFRKSMFMETGDVYGGSRNVGIMCDRFSAHEIDTPHDLSLAEWYHERGWV